jgi:hypothetical protein
MSFSKFQLAAFYSQPLPVCYDGDSGDPPEGQGNDDQQPQDKGGKTFTQEELNRTLAEDRRKHAAKLQALEAKLNETLESTKLTVQEREELQNSLEDMKKQFQTKEQIAAQEKKKLETQYQSELGQWKSRAEVAESKYTDSTIRRSLADAAVNGDAFSVEQIVTLLRPMAKLNEDKVVIDFNDRHVETGEAIVTQLSPIEAVKRMREIPEQFGNLFKSNVVSGMGAGSGQQHQSGKVDVRKLTPEQYKKMRKENPSALGF